MENQYGITVANKYALFLNEDEDPLEILKLQEASKSTKKSEKTKKSPGNENETKNAANKQAVSSEKKSNKIDHFSSPNQQDEKSQGKDKELRPVKERTKKGQDSSVSKPNFEQQKPKNFDGSNRTERPRRERTDRGGFSGGDRERRSDKPDSEQKSGAEQNELFDRPQRDSYPNRPPRYERSGFRGRPRGSYRGGGGFVDRSERTGFDEQPAERTFYGNDRPSRRGGGYRGRRGNRGGFGDRSGERRESENAEGQEHGETNDHRERDVSNQQRERGGGGGFGEWTERRGFDENNERSGFEERSAGREFVRRGRGGGRSFGRGRGGFDRPGKRDFDRHTEGGIRPPDKREGAGSHNWGTVMDDMDRGQQTDEKTPGESGATWAEQTDAEERAAAAEKDGETAGGEEDTKVMTLDEWKSMEDTKRVRAEFNIRKPGEGCSNDPQWKKMYALTKKEKPEEHEGDEEQQEEDERHNKQKNLLNIDIRFADNPRRGTGGGSNFGRGRGGGRGREGGRGGGGGGGGDSYRGGYRDDRSRRYGGGPRESAPNVDNELDFPSLDKTVKS